MTACTGQRTVCVKSLHTANVQMKSSHPKDRSKFPRPACSTLPASRRRERRHALLAQARLNVRLGLRRPIADPGSCKLQDFARSHNAQATLEKLASACFVGTGRGAFKKLLGVHLCSKFPRQACSTLPASRRRERRHALLAQARFNVRLGLRRPIADPGSCKLQDFARSHNAQERTENWLH